jgi:hypothetical protein
LREEVWICGGAAGVLVVCGGCVRENRVRERSNLQNGVPNTLLKLLFLIITAFIFSTTEIPIGY